MGKLNVEEHKIKTKVLSFTNLFIHKAVKQKRAYISSVLSVASVVVLVVLVVL